MNVNVDIRILALEKIYNGPNDKGEIYVKAILTEDEYEIYKDVRDTTSEKFVMINLDNSDIDKFGNLRDKIDMSDGELVWEVCGGVPLTFLEYEMLMQNISTSLQNHKYLVIDPLKEAVSKYLKFTKDEREIVNRGIAMLEKIIKENGEEDIECGDGCEWRYNYKNMIKYFNIVKLKGEKDERCYRYFNI